MRAREYLRYIGELLAGKRVRWELSIAARRRAAIETYLPKTEHLEVLDLANGRLSPQSYILARDGHRVTGVDLVNGAGPRLLELSYRAARALLRTQLGITPFRNGLVQLVNADVSRLPLRSESFDLVHSCAAFEHFSDVPSVVSETARVLKPGGVVFAGIHLFSTLTGGHDFYAGVTPAVRTPRGIRPWEHLRTSTWRESVPLNRLRRREFLDIFSRFFDVRHVENMPECSPALLTPGIRDSLPEYSEEELTNSIFIVGQKRAA